MVPQPARAALVVIGLLGACAGTNPSTGFAARPEQADAQRRCEAGSPAACGALGKMLTANRDASTDVERGVVLLGIACGQDNLPACTALADVYVRESHGKTSLARAHDLAARACTLRSGPACTQLGEVSGTRTGMRARGRKRSTRAAIWVTPRAVRSTPSRRGARKQTWRWRAPASSAGSRAATISRRSAFASRRRAGGRPPR